VLGVLTLVNPFLIQQRHITLSERGTIHGYVSIDPNNPYDPDKILVTINIRQGIPNQYIHLHVIFIKLPVQIIMQQKTVIDMADMYI